MLLTDVSFTTECGFTSTVLELKDYKTLRVYRGQWISVFKKQIFVCHTIYTYECGNQLQNEFDNSLRLMCLCTNISSLCWK